MKEGNCMNLGIKKESRTKVLNFIITLMVLCTSGIIQFTFIWNSQSIIMLFLLSCVLFFFSRQKLSRIRVIKALIFICIILVNVLVYSNNIDGHMALILIVVSCMMITQIMNETLFCKYYIICMTILCAISLICFSLYTIYPDLVNAYVPIIKYWSLESRYILVYNFPKSIYTMRNFGPFHEGGMFAIMIDVALLFLINDTNLKSRKSKLLSILMLVTVITTFSTTGILLVVIIFIFKFSSQISSKVNLRVVALWLALMALFVWEENTFGIVGSKFQKDNSSYTARISEFSLLYNHISDNLFWGVGYQNNEIVKNSGLRDGTNGVVSCLLQFGLIGGGMILMMYIQGLCTLAKTHKDAILYILVAFISFMSEPTIFTPMFLCALFATRKLNNRCVMRGSNL